MLILLAVSREQAWPVATSKLEQKQLEHLREDRSPYLQHLQEDRSPYRRFVPIDFHYCFFSGHRLHSESRVVDDIWAACFVVPCPLYAAAMAFSLFE